MTLTEYQTKATRTIRECLSRTQKIDHALFGMMSEVGEVAAHYQKVYQGHPIDLDKVEAEVGDLLWFITELCTAYGWSLEDVAQANIDKLLSRYPDGFDEERSLHREV